MELARKIAEMMPAVGSDRQRGGWYDVMERELKAGEKMHRFAWHDRKAWWQQEQAILAYLILHGMHEKPEYVKLARESPPSTTPSSSTTTTAASTSTCWPTACRT